MKTTKNHSALWLLVAAGLLATGCEGTSEPVESQALRLQRAQSCADLEALLKEDALVKMNAQIDAMIANFSAYGYGYSSGSGGGPVPVDSPEMTQSGGDPSAPPRGPSAPAGDTAGNETADGGAAHSDTNTQVAGVDEADIVKTDGNNIYLLHGQNFTTLSAYPAASLALSSSLVIEGMPTEMFVAGDKVVVYSLVDGTPVFEAAGVAPRPYSGGYGYGGPGPVRGDGATAEDSGPYYGGFTQLTKITILSLDTGSPAVARELYFEGGYVSSRRVESHVRTVLTGGAYGPELRYWPEFIDSYPETELEWTAALEQLRAENAAAIEGAPLSTWLPYRFEKQADAVAALDASCADYYVPTEGSTGDGLTQIESVDLDQPTALPTSTSVVGATDTVYSNQDSLYLAARGWEDPSIYASPAAPSDTLRSTARTHLHKFDLTIDPSRPLYVASGSVPGYIKNQFSLDEKDGKLRIATTDQLSSATEWTTSNSLFVLGTSGDELTRIGAVEGLAAGEQIFSTRFVGNKGYIVTFRQTDPLFVFDLADPTAPTLLGELEIPGFSEYMHPLDDNHLLTIGRDATTDGQVTGLALQIFDVTAPAAPALLHKEVLGGQGAYSDAEHNHKSFTYYDELGVLAFPLVNYDYDTGAVQSTLQLFRASAADGFEALGAVDHSAFFSPVTAGDCYYSYYGAEVRRGLFIDNLVYSISYGGVLVNSLDDLTVPVASLALPAATVPVDGCGGVSNGTEEATPPSPEPTPGK